MPHDQVRASMEKRIIFFMVFFALKALSQDIPDWVGIDCGSKISYPNGDYMTWQTDDDFIKTGKNEQVSLDNYTTWVQLNTLRVFTEQNKNCYSLPTATIDRYFIRAVFYYGNYDGLLNPPTFDLEFDGNKWATVVTSLIEPVYHEMIYTSTGENASVCLARTQDEQLPFISSLEVWSLPDDMYVGMARNLAWFCSNGYRYDYGATVGILGYPEDDYNRIWQPMTPSGLDVVTADFSYIYETPVESPPDSAILQGVEPPIPNDTIILPFSISKANVLNYVVLYFTEVADLDTNETRSFDLYVNDKFVETISPQYQYCTDASASTPSVTTMTVELRPTANSTLPPIICAIEVYTASDPLVTMGTSQDDLDGLALFTRNFEQLEGWSGDPCLPSHTVWQWLKCTGDDPPRVTSLNLSGYGLDGPLPDFSKMQALETIDLGYNNLDGPIPDFLGDLPNLSLLILRHNNFSGAVPQSITHKKNFKYDVSENPGLKHKGKKIGLIVGLAVGLPLGILLLIALLYFLTRKQPIPSPGKPQAEIVSVGVIREAPITRSQANGQNITTPGGENILAAENAGNSNQPLQANDHEHPEAMAAGEKIQSNEHGGTTSHLSVAPKLDMEEFDELFQQGNVPARTI